jgi:hypothetical protein
MSAVRIKSASHPDGKLYSLANKEELAVAALEELIDLHRKSAALANPGKARRTRRRLSKLLAEAVRILLPAIEPDVLRRLPDDARRQVLEHWAEVNT